MEEQDIDIVIEKPSRAKRIMRSIAARLRRKVVKEAKSAHEFKEEKEARERLKAKKLLEKQQKRAARRRETTSS